MLLGQTKIETVDKKQKNKNYVALRSEMYLSILGI